MAGCSDRRTRGAARGRSPRKHQDLKPRRTRRTRRKEHWLFFVIFVTFVVSSLRDLDSWQPEDVEHAARCGGLRQVRHGVDESERSRGVTRIETAGDDRARPSTDTRENRDVLLAIGSAIGHRLADDPGANFRLPELLARLRVDCLEPAVHRAVERDVAGGDRDSTPDRKALLDRPYLFAADRVPRDELAAVAA